MIRTQECYQINDKDLSSTGYSGAGNMVPENIRM